MDKVPMTADGHAALEAELQKRQAEDRPAIIQAIAEARAHGDLETEGKEAKISASSLVARRLTGKGGPDRVSVSGRAKSYEILSAN